MPSEPHQDPILDFVTNQAMRQRSDTDTARCYDLLATRVPAPPGTRVSAAEIERAAQVLTVLNLFATDVAEQIAGFAGHTGFTPELANQCSAADHAARAAVLLTGALAAATAAHRDQAPATRNGAHRTALAAAADELRAASLVLMYGRSAVRTPTATASRVAGTQPSSPRR
ncbi:hypothetical protein LO772_29650 [Yinghuangia sp. ASG 101]|uniref:hypothetical protein n=1 Tax=Yinghuangia sp. ASG 101 TaxID=2896848 RepID=UPI001E57441D|nr:hypothetical protein [Yinghuangia sp. ASG 101]UGQ10934.1 hypothetical protein LO772_29650 [Yinghuangia sp. ASG 101]